MGSGKIIKKYYCNEECRQSGCKGHIMAVEYRNTSDVVSLTIDKTFITTFSSESLNTFLKILKDTDGIYFINV